MNRRLILLLVVALLVSLALGGWLLAQAASPPPGEVGYRLETGGWRVQGVASGPGYRLELPGASSGTGTPCCCTFMPCVRR